jgi:chorismate synthase
MTTARDQFVEDFILVTDNDRDSYEGAKEIVLEKESLTAISEEMQEQFEAYISQVADREEALGHEAGALLIRQMLIGWGNDAFDHIARHYMEKE